MVIRLYQRKEREGYSDRIIEPMLSISKCRDIVSDVVMKSSSKCVIRERKIDKILTNRVTGIPIMLLTLFFIFWLTIVGSNYPSELLSNFLFNRLIFNLFASFEENATLRVFSL